MEDLFQAS